MPIEMTHETTDRTGRFTGSCRLTPRPALRDAARASGYSAVHLGRLVRAGAEEDFGRPNAPKIRLSDLPRKGGTADAGGLAKAAAEKLASELRQGARIFRHLMDGRIRRPF